jgi:hypothetical protein
MAASGHAAAAPLPKSYAAPCADSDEFAFAQRALVQARRDMAAKHYHAASQTLRNAADRLDVYTTNRIFAAGQTILDDTGQHLSLARWLEQRGDLKTSLHISEEMLTETIRECRDERKDISDKLRKLSGH